MRTEAAAHLLGEDENVGWPGEKAGTGQRHPAGPEARTVVSRVDETGDQPAERKGPGKPERDPRAPASRREALLGGTADGL
jgi:hypothetical protein